MRTRPFKQVDVFTATPYLGNPVAVVLDGRDLSDAQMQQFAHWAHLSETTFLLPARDPQADYRVRIFTPGGELPFAGHPTLGSCHAWLQAGGAPRFDETVVQECAIGLVRIRRDGARLAFAAPPLQRSEPSPALLAEVSAALGLETSQVLAAQVLDNGPVWLGLILDRLETVLQLAPDHFRLKALGQLVGVASLETASAAVTLIARSNREARAFGARSMVPAAADFDATELEVRAFAAPLGVDEDPVTGSLHASLAQWLIADGLAPRAYVAAQGRCLGRAGRVHIAQAGDGQVWVGGNTVTCIDGSVRL